MELISLIFGLIWTNSTVPLMSISADSVFMPDSTPLNYVMTAEESKSGSFYFDCNQNPNQYNKYHHKLIKGNCDNCLKEIWRINGKSMNPTLKTGSLLKMQMQPDTDKLKEGMIVVYDARKDIKGSPLDMDNLKQFDYNTIHRIVSVNEDGYVIKGDNNNVCELLKKSDIKAVLESIDY